MNLQTISTLFLLLLLFTAAPRSQTNARPGGQVAYVSMQRIASETSDAKVAAAKLDTMRQEKAREVAAKQKALDAAHLAVVQAGGMFQRSRRAALQADENRQRAELQQLAERAQADLQNLQRQLQSELRDKMTTILDKLARQKGVQIVLNGDAGVLWAPAGADLTTEVVSLLNAAAPPKQTPQ